MPDGSEKSSFGAADPDAYIQAHKVRRNIGYRIRLCHVGRILSATRIPIPFADSKAQAVRFRTLTKKLIPDSMVSKTTHIKHIFRCIKLFRSCINVTWMR